MAFEARAPRTFVVRRRSVSLFARFRAAHNSVRLARCPSLSEAALPEVMAKRRWRCLAAQLVPFVSVKFTRSIVPVAQVLDCIQ